MNSDTKGARDITGPPADRMMREAPKTKLGADTAHGRTTPEKKKRKSRMESEV